ncbi:hypothetical protein LTR28_001061, partial [Elasticomyces elasticus]
MLPCPIWFWYRWASAAFLCAVFIWSVYNGATYYIDVFGKRMEKELEELRREVSRWQGSSDAGHTDPKETKGTDDQKGNVPMKESEPEWERTK